MSIESTAKVGPTVRFDVVLACYNRRELTLRALRSAHDSAEKAGVEAAFTLFDDGSTDGTSDAVNSLPFLVDVVHGEGDAFWAQGMARAEQAALRRGPRDAIVWLNDDVEVDDDAFSRLLDAMRRQPAAVHVGSTREPDGRLSYSGYRRAGRHPLRLHQVEPLPNQQQHLDTFNGNLVLIPESVRSTVGDIDGGFAHQLADIDYGYRVTRAGHDVLLEPGTFGTCSTNVLAARNGAREDWRRFTSAKGGGHPASMRRFLQRYSRLTWPFWMLQTYALWWARRALGALGRSD